MIIDIKVPAVGESITEVTLVKWFKRSGEWVERDEVIAELESEKATFEINAESSGVLQLIVSEGEDLKIGAVVGQINTDVQRPENLPSETLSKTENKAADEISENHNIKTSPVAAAIISDKGIRTESITPSGFGGKILKQDVMNSLDKDFQQSTAVPFTRNERVEKMSNLRRTVSRRLVDAKNSTAMLTTFNEVDMSAVMKLRSAFKDKFKEIHGVNLGFMSFFAKASCYALQEFPSVNAMIGEGNIIYHEYCDISVAVSAPKGLVVPVIRNAESMSMSQLEQKVAELAARARENKLTIEEMSGGTFTITNGGVFGSLMSTPIINIPQSAILGMHKIQERPVAINGEVVIRPMMYTALSYDHRIIDGREAVSFLVRIKELLENPSHLLFGKDPFSRLLDL